MPIRKDLEKRIKLLKKIFRKPIEEASAHPSTTLRFTSLGSELASV
mgnify:CR=1 FL=1